MSAGHLMERTAQLSDDGQFRWTLGRRWTRGATLVWVMLNPSTADFATDDRTMKQVIWFSDQAGFAACEVLNLYPFRTPNPALIVADPASDSRNDMGLEAALVETRPIVCAWGTHPAGSDRGRRFTARAVELGRPLLCLGTTRNGSPCHPCRLPRSRTLQVYR